MHGQQNTLKKVGRKRHIPRVLVLSEGRERIHRNVEHAFLLLGPL